MAEQQQNQPPKKAYYFNKTDRLLHFAGVTSRNKHSYEGREHETVIYEPKTLFVGVNLVERNTAFEQFLKSETHRALAKKGKVEVINLDKDGKPSKGLLQFEEDRAFEFINECYQLQLLDEWAEIDDRREVVEAIKARKRELTKELNVDEGEDVVRFRNKVKDEGNAAIA